MLSHGTLQFGHRTPFVALSRSPERRRKSRAG
jgi:hypothetical protein